MNIFRLAKKLIRENLGMPAHFTILSKQQDELKMLTARILINQIKSRRIYNDIHQTEFKVFSQFGDDGIIQYLINDIDNIPQTFIEFGVENYTESNTRFLLMNDNWKGLILDADKEGIDYLKQDDIYWRHDLTAVHAFISKENINRIIAENGFSGEIGLLGIDIDGNDYWIWECMDAVKPVIVVVEYNSILGHEHAVTILYDPVFNRTKAHYSNLYWGCSLKALCLLAERKGYAFVGSNSNGNNAYFVRKDRLGNIKTFSAKEGYVESRFRESRDIHGRLSYLAGSKRVRAIGDMLLYDVEKKATTKIKDIFAEVRI